MQWLEDRLNWMKILVERNIGKKKQFWSGYLQATLEIQKLMEDEEKKCAERLEADRIAEKKKMKEEYEKWKTSAQL